MVRTFYTGLHWVALFFETNQDIGLRSKIGQQRVALSDGAGGSAKTAQGREIELFLFSEKERATPDRHAFRWSVPGSCLDLSETARITLELTVTLIMDWLSRYRVPPVGRD